MLRLWSQASPGAIAFLEPSACLLLVQKRIIYSIYFISSWYVIEITGQSAGTSRIQIHSLLYHQLCLTRQQCRVASLLESPGEWLFAKWVGASAQTRIPPFVISTLRFWDKRLMLKRLSLPGRSIVVLTWTEYRTAMFVQKMVISDTYLHSSCGAVG